MPILLKQKPKCCAILCLFEDFNKKWAFMGVILTDMDLNRYQKLFNLNVRGRSRYSMFGIQRVLPQIRCMEGAITCKRANFISLYEKL